MKFCSAFSFTLSVSTVLSLTIPREASVSPAEELYTLELAPGKTKQVTEAEKWVLYNVRSLF